MCTDPVKNIDDSYFPPNSLAVSVDNVLTAAECEHLIAIAESGNPQYVTSATLEDGTSIELMKPNPHRVAVFDSSSFANEHGSLWSKIKRLVCCGSNETWHSSFKNYFDREDACSRPTAGLPTGINPRFRVLRYNHRDHDEFLPHYDATTNIGECQSALTILIYLNDNFVGGETVFLCPNKFDVPQPPPASLASSFLVSITPQIGKCVIFEHNLFHAGLPLSSGVKWILRTDILFEKNNNPSPIVETAAPPPSTVIDMVTKFPTHKNSITDLFDSLGVLHDSLKSLECLDKGMFKTIASEYHLPDNVLAQLLASF